MALPDGLRVECPRCGATLQAGSTGHSACPLVRARVVNSDGRECDRYGNLLDNGLLDNATRVDESNSQESNKFDKRAYQRAYMASRRKKAGD